jgi:hypothetical protein
VAGYGCVSLESVLERVCIVRVARRVIPGDAPSKKRKGAVTEDGFSNELGCYAAYFILNDMVGAVPVDYTYIHPVLPRPVVQG